MLLRLHPDLISRHGRLVNQVNTRRNGQNVLRNFAAPDNEQSTAQVAVRGAITGASQAYSGLTASELAAWETLAANYTRLDRAGNEYPLTGQQMYNAVNAYRLMDGQAVSDTAPTYDPINDVGAVTSITIAAGQWTIVLPELTVPDNSLAVLRFAIVDNVIYKSQPADYKLLCTDLADAIVDIGAAAGGVFTIVVADGDINTWFGDIAATDIVRCFIKILGADYCLPTLPPGTPNYSGEITCV